MSDETIEYKLTFEEYERLKEWRRLQDRKTFLTATFIAIIMHIGILYMVFPDFTGKIFKKDPPKVITIRKLPPPRKKIPPPPPKKKVPKKKRKIVPIPDPTPDEPEIEPDPLLEPEDPFENIPEDVMVVFGDPQAPPLPEGPIVITGDIVPPKAIGSTVLTPVYPETARMLRIEGDVVVRFTVTKQGIPQDFVIVKSLGEKTGCDQAVLESLKKYRFRPALQNGKPVWVYYEMTFNFSLKK